MKKIIVVAAMLEKCGKVLIAQRSYGDLEGKWEFPGGKVESNETYEQAIVREMYEEFHISVKCDGFVCKNLFQYPDREIELHLYHCSYIDGDVILTSHNNYIYVDKSLLLSYDLAPADVDLAKYIMNN